MVGENLLQRIKQGYTFKIKEPKYFKPPREYLEATEKYSKAVRLGAMENFQLCWPSFPRT